MCLLEETTLALQKGAIGRSHQVSRYTTTEKLLVAARGSETYTDRFLSSLIALISIFLRPISRALRRRAQRGGMERVGVAADNPLLLAGYGLAALAVKAGLVGVKVGLGYVYTDSCVGKGNRSKRTIAWRWRTKDSRVWTRRESYASLLFWQAGLWLADLLRGLIEGRGGIEDLVGIGREGSQEVGAGGL